MNIDQDKLAEILQTLRELPKIKEVKELQKRLQKELKTKTKKLKILKQKRKTLTNQNRSAKQKRYWRYVKLIRDNFPNVTTTEIRSQLKERRQGKTVQINDAIWQNPSG